MTSSDRLGLVDVILIGLAVVAVGMASASFLSLRNSRSGEGNPEAALAGLVGNSLAGIDILNGDSTRARFDPAADAAHAIILVFKSTCPVCEANAERWHRVFANVDDRTKIIAVATESRDVAEEWLTRHDLVDTIDLLLVPASYEELQKWNISRVPTTLKTDRDGNVVYAHLGLLGEDDLAELTQLAANDE